MEWMSVAKCISTFCQRASPRLALSAGPAPYGGIMGRRPKNMALSLSPRKWVEVEYYGVIGNPGLAGWDRVIPGSRDTGDPPGAEIPAILHRGVRESDNIYPARGAGG